MWIEVLRAIAHPWMCDVMSHLNVRHYSAIFDDASAHFIAAIGLAADRVGESSSLWADVSLKCDFRKDVLEGQLLVVRSQVLRLGNTSLTTQYEMRSANTEVLHATLEAVTVHLDAASRKPAPLPAALRDRLQPYLNIPPSMPVA